MEREREREGERKREREIEKNRTCQLTTNRSVQHNASMYQHRAPPAIILNQHTQCGHKQKGASAHPGKADSCRKRTLLVEVELGDKDGRESVHGMTDTCGKEIILVIR